MVEATLKSSRKDVGVHSSFSAMPDVMQELLFERAPSFYLSDTTFRCFSDTARVPTISIKVSSPVSLARFCCDSVLAGGICDSFGDTDSGSSSPPRG